MSTVQRILKYIFISLGVLIVAGICVASALGYFMNDKLVNYVNTLDNQVNNVLNNSINQIETQVTDIKNLLVGTGQNPPSINENITSIMTEIDTNLANPATPVETITTLQDLKQTLSQVQVAINTGGDIDTAINQAADYARQMVQQANEINSQYINPVVTFVRNDSKNICLYVFIGTTILLGLGAMISFAASVTVNKRKKAELLED